MMQVKNWILIIFVSLFLFVSNAVATGNTQPITPLTPKKEDLDSEKSGVKVGDIYVACRYYFSKVFATKENVSRKNICNGYFFGAASMLLLLQSEKREIDTCIPMDASTEEIITAFIKWAEKHPEKNDMLASAALLNLLRESYPCDKGYVPKGQKDKTVKE